MNSPVLKKYYKGFSLVEVITVLIIATMIVMATLTIYGRVRSATASINLQLDKDTIPREILQRIAEDIDRYAVAGPDTTMTIENKYDASGYTICRMVIENKIYDKRSKPRTFEKVTWMTHFDTFEESLILYRSHIGLNLEEKIIATQRQIEQNELGEEIFVPVVAGLTYFTIQVPEDPAKATQGISKIKLPEPEELLLDKWTKKELPRSVKVSLSFADPIDTIDGGIEVPQEDIYVRTVATDRVRKIKFVFVKKDIIIEYPTEKKKSVSDPNQTAPEVSNM